jgi:hypothetical protein
MQNRVAVLTSSVLIALFSTCANVAYAQAQSAAPQVSVRAEIVKPLQDARAALQAMKYADALVALKAADAVGKFTPEEAVIVERMRALAAEGTGDSAGAIKAIEFLLGSDKVPAADKAQYETTLFNLYIKQKDHRNIIKLGQRLMQEAATATPPNTARVAEFRSNILPSAVALEDWSLAAKSIDDTFAEMQKANRPLPESLIKARGGIAARMKDNAAYLLQVERLATLYPSKEYWQDAISRHLDPKTFAQRHIVDLLRFKLALGYPLEAEEYVNLASLAQEAGFPIEADRAMQAGFAAGVLGKGAEAGKQTALRDKSARDAAEDRKNLPNAATNAAAIKEGPALFNAGFNLVTSGDAAKGIPLMEEGIKRAGLRHPEDLRLRMGAAYALAGQNEAATKTLAAVTGEEGRAGLARLWTLYTKRVVAAKK